MKRISTTLWYFLSVFSFAFLLCICNGSCKQWLILGLVGPYSSTSNLLLDRVREIDNGLFDDWNWVATQVSTFILKFQFEYGSSIFSLGSISMCCFCACISKVWNFFPISFFLVIMSKCVIFSVPLKYLFYINIIVYCKLKEAKMVNLFVRINPNFQTLCLKIEDTPNLGRGFLWFIVMGRVSQDCAKILMWWNEIKYFLDGEILMGRGSE